MNRVPMLNRAAIGPQAAGPALGPVQGQGPAEDREQAERKRAERKRVEVAVEFGAALEDLVAYVHLVAHDRLQRDEADAAPRESEAGSRTSLPRFPPDLLVELAPKAHLQRVRQKLRKLEPMVLSSEQPDGAEQREQAGQQAQQQGQARQQQAMQARRQPRPGETAAGGAKPKGIQQQPGSGKMQPGSSRTEQREQRLAPEGARKPPSRPDGTEEQIQDGQAQQEQARQAPAQERQQQESGGTEQQLSSEEVRQSPPRSNEVQQTRQQAQPQRQPPSGPGGTPPVSGAGETRPPLSGPDGTRQQLGFSIQPPRSAPSKEFKIEKRIDDLLPGHDGQGANGSRDHESPPSSLGGLYDAICRWNESVVEHLVDSPAVLSGFRVGKALSFTRWQIRRADERWNRANGVPAADPWHEAFCKQRIDEIQRHANVLSSVLDPRAVAAVVTGLGYWRSSLLYLTSLGEPSRTWSWSWWRQALRRLASLGEPASARSHQPSSYKEQPIEISRADREELMKALEEQVETWLDVMTERRPPESFPVAGIVTSLTKKVAANLWAKLFRFLVPALIVLVIVGALAAAIAAVLPVFKDVSSDTWYRLLGGLGTVLVAVFTTMFAPRGQSLLGRGPGAANSAGGRAGEVPRSGVAFRDNFGVGRAIVSGAANLKQDALSEVVEQLRLEELNLAVSDPLVRCVLALRGQETGDPQKDAERFLQLVYKNESNLKRLRPVFKDLYKY